LMTFSSTFISHAKFFQFGINLMSLSKHNANCSMSGSRVRMMDSLYLEAVDMKTIKDIQSKKISVWLVFLRRSYKKAWTN
jgi:hypothetical protein